MVDIGKGKMIMQLRLAVLLATFVASSSVLPAQIGTATILGTVTDATGASVFGADVLVTHTETNRLIETKSSETGFFTVPGIPVGLYQVEVRMDGFKSAIRTGINLRVADRQQIDFQLEIGEIVESVEVVGQAPLVESSNATVGKVLENQRVKSLPLNGRSALALVVLTPNVRFSSLGPAGFSDRGVLVSAFSVNGGPV